MTKDLLSRFTSRKFLLAVFGLVIILLQGKVHFTPEQIDGITAVIIAFTAAEGIADAVTRYTNIPEIEEDTETAKKKK